MDDFREFRPALIRPYRRNEGAHETGINLVQLKDQTEAALRQGVICKVQARRIAPQQTDCWAEEGMGRKTLAELVADYLLAHPGAHTAKDIAEAVGAEHQDVSRLSKHQSILRRRHQQMQNRPMVFWHSSHDKMVSDVLKKRSTEQ